MQQDIEPFTAPLVAPQQLPPVLPKLPETIQHGHSSFGFEIPQDASGQAAPRSRGQPPPVGSTAAAIARPTPQVPPGTAYSATSFIHASASIVTPVPVGAAALVPVGAAPVPVGAAPVPVAAPDEKRVPRTTAWRRRKLAEAATAAAAQGLTPRKRQIPLQFICQKCGQPKTKEFGHSQFRGVHFCAKASGKTVAQWMEEVKRGETK